MGIPLEFRFFLSVMLILIQSVSAQNDVLPSRIEITFKVSRSQDLDKIIQCSHPDEVLKAIQSELSIWQNSGYPFAQVQIDTIFNSEKISIMAAFNPGPLITNGELVLHGDSSFRLNTLRNWIRFKKNAVFSSQKFSRVPFLASQIPFAEEVNIPALEWFGNQAVIHLFLRKRKINSFTGILGVLPQSGTTGPIITGNLDGSLTNVFGRGISLNFKWTRFARSSQTAAISIQAPALNTSGLGAEGNFELFRQDSLLIKQKGELHLLNTNSSLLQFRVGISASSASGRLANVDPGLYSVKTKTIILGLRFEPVFPNQIQLKRKGVRLQVAASVKDIARTSGTNSIPQFDFQSTGFFPLITSLNRFCLLSSWNIGMLMSKEITLPDQYRLGGSLSFRGFNENSFFTSQHIKFSLQPQYLIEKNLLAGVFVEYMVFNPERSQVVFNSASGAYSLGFTSEIELGPNLVQISFANGFSKDLPFDFQTTKIHFGYVARF